jgi:hypothetical protein
MRLNLLARRHTDPIDAGSGCGQKGVADQGGNGASSTRQEKPS